MGYGPAPREEAAPEPGAGDAAPSFGDEVAPFVKYNPDQPRVSAGNSDGGQWTDGGGGGSSGVRVAQAATGTLNDAGEEESLVHLAQARGGRGRAGPRAGENFEITPAQQMRLNNAENWARERIGQVRRFDPEWRPEPSFVQSAEGAISRAEGEARAAEARMQALFRDAVPGSNPDWGVNRLRDELRARGYIYRAPTRKSTGQILTDPSTGAEIRIMERPSREHRSDPAQKHIYDYYYRYKPNKGSRWGSHIPIPNKDALD